MINVMIKLTVCLWINKITQHPSETQRNAISYSVTFCFFTVWKQCIYQMKTNLDWLLIWLFLSWLTHCFSFNHSITRAWPILGFNTDAIRFQHIDRWSENNAKHYKMTEKENILAIVYMTMRSDDWRLENYTEHWEFICYWLTTNHEIIWYQLPSLLVRL